MTSFVPDLYVTSSILLHMLGGPMAHAQKKTHFEFCRMENAQWVNNCPMFNPKPHLESSGPWLQPLIITHDLASAPGGLIRDFTVNKIAKGQRSMKYYLKIFIANLMRLLYN